jgi:hypothetical protein
MVQTFLRFENHCQNQEILAVSPTHKVISRATLLLSWMFLTDARQTIQGHKSISIIGIKAVYQYTNLLWEKRGVHQIDSAS